LLFLIADFGLRIEYLTQTLNENSAFPVPKSAMDYASFLLLTAYFLLLTGSYVSNTFKVPGSIFIPGPMVVEMAMVRI
jgi:hypothetical protein